MKGGGQQRPPQRQRGLEGRDPPPQGMGTHGKSPVPREGTGLPAAGPHGQREAAAGRGHGGDTPHSPETDWQRRPPFPALTRCLRLSRKGAGSSPC